MVVTHKIDPSGQIKTLITDTVFSMLVPESWYVEDTDRLVESELQSWWESDSGNFIIKRSTETPSVYTNRTIANYAIEIAVVATLEQKHFSEYLLKWGKHGSNASR